MGLMHVNLSALEPFDAYLIGIAGWGSIAIAILGLVASLFVSMAYCRYGCPTGALLSFLRRNSSANQWSAGDSAATALLLVAALLHWM
jgi:polyferredoxin